MDYVTLIGSEGVLRASFQMALAADKLEASIANFESALHQNQQFMNEWLEIFKEVVEKLQTNT